MIIVLIKVTTLLRILNQQFDHQEYFYHFLQKNVFSNQNGSNLFSSSITEKACKVKLRIVDLFLQRLWLVQLQRDKDAIYISKANFYRRYLCRVSQQRRIAK